MLRAHNAFLLPLLIAASALTALTQPSDLYRLTRNVSTHAVNPAVMVVDSINTKPDSADFTLTNHEVFSLTTAGTSSPTSFQPFLTAVVLADGRADGSPESIDLVVNQRRVYRDSYEDILPKLLASKDKSSKNALIAELETARDQRIETEKDTYLHTFIRAAYIDCIANLKANLSEDQYTRRIEHLISRYTDYKTRLDTVRQR